MHSLWATGKHCRLMGSVAMLSLMLAIVSGAGVVIQIHRRPLLTLQGWSLGK